MKNLVGYVLATMIVTFALGGATATKAQDQGYIRELYKKMEQNQRTLTSLKTGIRMEKYNLNLKDYDDRREGTALVVPIKNSRNANFRLDWTKGAQETLSVVNGKYRLYRPRLQQMVEGKSKNVAIGGGGAKNIFGLINSSAKDLKTNFAAEWRGQEIVANVHSTYKLELTPKTQMSFNKAEIWVNEDGMVVQIKVYEKNGDWTNILLFDIQKNVNVKNQIAFNPPKGTNIIPG